MGKNSLSRDEIIHILQQFARDFGRPPKQTDVEMVSIVYFAKKEFGSWSYALKIAGLQTFKVWRGKKSLASKVRSLLDHNPMTLKELQNELLKQSSVPQSVKNSSTPICAIARNCLDIKSIGPRRNRVYFIKGQERLAQTHLDSVLSRFPNDQELLFYTLRKPMTKEEIIKLLPDRKYICEKWLKELILAGLIYKARFVARARGGIKYSAYQIFGELAGKTYYCRFDCPEEIVELIMENVPTKELCSKGFSRALNYRLKRILSPEAFNCWERKYLEIRDRFVTPKNHCLDDFLQ